MKKIINCETGEVTERELNAEELAQQQLDEIKFQEALVLMEAEKTKKAAAEAKLAALGLTSDDLKALGL